MNQRLASIALPADFVIGTNHSVASIPRDFVRRLTHAVGLAGPPWVSDEQSGQDAAVVSWLPADRRHDIARHAFEVPLFDQLREDLFERGLVHEVAQAFHRIGGDDAAPVNDDYVRADLLHYLEDVR